MKVHFQENKELHKTDPINLLLDKLSDKGQVGKDYSITELFLIYEEAEKRYTYKLPPGYMDDKRYNTKNGKESPDKFGDYLIWKQMIKKSLEDEKSILFITNDQKEDWLEGKELRKDLIEEFREHTNSQEINRLSFEELINDELNIRLDPLLKLELFSQDYIDKSEIESEIEMFLSDNRDIRDYLNKQIRGEEFEIEEVELVKLIDLSLSDAVCLEKADEYIVYELLGDSKLFCRINDFYEVEIDVEFEIMLTYELLKEDYVEEFSLDLQEINYEEVNFGNFKEKEYKDICPICKIREGEHYHYDTGGYVCDNCSTSLICCTHCGRFFDEDSPELFGVTCKDCLEYLD